MRLSPIPLVPLLLLALAPAARAQTPAPPPPPPPAGLPAQSPPPPHEFLAEARTLLVVGACADGPEYTAGKDIVAAHCKKLRAAQEDYKSKWITPVRAFMAEHVPAGDHIPKNVIYPFAGGDLISALVVFPDADMITTLSLEPAGDPTALAHLSPKQLETSLDAVDKELTSLYRSSFSVTMNMIETMRGGHLPTQLIFSLSALAMQGYEPTSMLYFRLTPDGDVQYYTDADLAAIDAKVPWTDKDTLRRNRDFSDVEIRFHKIGTTREQVYRHILANLDDKHIKESPAAMHYLQKQGTVSAMTKAASYLLSFEEFSEMRKWIINNVFWMVSDTSGLPPSYGRAAGLDYEVYGEFDKPNMPAGEMIAPVWKKEYAAQPKRPLPFRFGYPDAHAKGNLVIMWRPNPPMK